jgi:hypothetical protein
MAVEHLGRKIMNVPMAEKHQAVSPPFPNAVGIGFGKAGTTFIADVLGNHPEVCFSSRKETHFFSGDDYPLGFPHYAEYFSHFDAGVHRVVTEWSNDYILSEVALRRIKETLGDHVKVLICYRDPVEAFLSDIKYRMTIYKLDVHCTPREFFRNNPKYIEELFYDMHLEIVFRLFPRSSVFIMRYENLKSNPQDFFRRLFEFLAISNVDVYSKLTRTNVSQPFRNRKFHGLLYYLLKGFYGDRQATKLLRCHPRDKPRWLRFVQGMNTKSVELDPEFRRELHGIFSPHMEKLHALLHRK